MSGKKKVLMAGNNPEVAGYLRNFIPLLGNYEVEQAFNHMEALAKIHAFEPELVILDFDTPQIEAGKILREIRRGHSNLRILALVRDPEEEARLKQEGFLDGTVNPSDLTSLSQTVKRLLPVGEGVGEPEYARLLVADDEPGMCELLVELLTPLGIEVYGTSDGEEAFRIFKEKKCNLALIDLRMPKMDGVELIKRLEKSSDPPVPKAIMIMAAALGDTQMELGRLGYPILAKPMDVEILEEKMLDACKKYGLATKNP